MKVNNRPILVIEDDMVDVMTIQRACGEIKIPNRLVSMEHGEAALAYLNDPDSQTPCIILLDLNMPVMNGIEFLDAIKRHERLRRVPVIVLTTSAEESDKVNSFNLGVAGYMVKPVDYRSFVEMMRSIDRYWTVSELP